MKAKKAVPVVEFREPMRKGHYVYLESEDGFPTYVFKLEGFGNRELYTRDEWSGSNYEPQWLWSLLRENERHTLPPLAMTTDSTRVYIEDIYEYPQFWLRG